MQSRDPLGPPPPTRQLIQSLLTHQSKAGKADTFRGCREVKEEEARRPLEAGLCSQLQEWGGYTDGTQEAMVSRNPQSPSLPA